MKKDLSFLLITLLLSLLFVGKVSAESKISVTVKADPNDGGTVWVSDSYTANNNGKTTYTSKSSAGIFGLWATKTTPAYIFAEPNVGYKFMRWQDSNGNVVSTSASNNARYGKLGDEWAHDQNMTFEEEYTAVFEEVTLLNATFNNVERGGGKYVANYTINTTESKNSVITTSESTKLQYSDVEISSISLEAIPDDGYRFLRWRVEYSDPALQPQYYNKPKTEISVSKSFTLYCEFISSDYAQFILHGSSENSYLKLSDAIVAAQQGSNKVIVVNNSGMLYNEKDETDAIPNVYDPSTNTYTIPSNVTLVVPGDSKHTYKVTEKPIDAADFAYETTPPFEPYCIFTIPASVNLNFDGNLCVYASLSCNGSYMGQPRYYGQIHLSDNANITLNKMAYVLGYITGNHNTTSVYASENATVYEVLQIRDWRGGTGTANMLDDNKRVFPLNNYFVQNIETNLVLNAGAHEYVCTGVEMTKTDLGGILGDATETFFANACWVSPKDGSSALIKLGDNTRLEKYFDRENNRLIIDIISSDKETITQFDHIEISLKGYPMNSSEFVFPITPNLSVNLINTHAEVLYPLEFLAGSYLSIDQNSKLDASAAAIYVYDENENTVFYDGTNGKIAAGSHGYFCSNNQPIFNLGVYPTSPGNPTVGSKVISDACVDVNGELIGKIITTQSGASIISSFGTGKVRFTGLPAEPAYQVLQWHNSFSDNGLVYLQIPTNSSATLLNEDGNYSAGNGEEDNDKIYTYYPFAPNEGSDERGRWLSEVPSGSVGLIVDGKTNEIDITIPEIISDIVVSLTPDASDLTINSIAGIAIEGTHFSKQSDNFYNYNPETGQIDVTLQYDPQKSNGTVTERMLITLNCTNTTTGVDVDVLADEVMLIAREDYTPEFKVNDTENAEITLEFTAKVGKESEGQTITITPIPNNVSDKKYKEETWYVTWEPSALPENSPFIIEGNDYFDGVTVKYKPETILPPHNQTLTITARYDENTYTTKTINLQGTPSLAPNQLAFIANEKIIFPGDEINPLFLSKGNQTKIEYTYNGQPTNDNVVVEIDNDNNSLRVKSGVHIIEQQEITIVATQNENDKTESGHSIMKVIVKPSVQWNWSDLYFDNVYTDPIVVQGGGDYTLTLKDGCGELIDYNEITKSIVIGNGSECTAIFEYKKGDYSLDLESFIYQNPRIIPMCVNGINATRIYKGITTSVTTDNFGLPLVTYDGGILFATTASSSASWTFAIIGIPDKLQFIPTGNKEWTIYESEDGNSWGDPTLAKQPIVISPGEMYFTHQLKTTTKYIRIVCDLGEEDGKITELCVTELSDAANSTTNIVYLPIAKDADGEIIASQESLTIQYVSVDNPLSLVVKDDDGNAVEGLSLSSNTLNATTVTDPSSKETITITNNSHSTDETLYLVVLDNKDEVKLSIPIRMYHYPQSLPMRSADWTGDDAEKYHFYKVQSQYVSFDNSTQEVVFHPSGNSQRSIAFAFKGGPSYIQFETTTKLTNENWSDNWTVEVYDGTQYQTIKETPEITPILVGETTYYRVRVAIPYTSKKVILANNLSVSSEKIRNVIIDGEPDLDVQTGNHTIEHTAKYNFTTNAARNVVVTAINLETLKVRSTNSNFTVELGETTINSTPTTLDATSCSDALGTYKVGDITFSVKWAAINAIDEGLLIFTDDSNNELASVRLLGTMSYITADNANETNMYTGFASNITSHPFTTIFEENENYNFERKEIKLNNTFASDGTALFDYLIVYGETSTIDNTTIVSPPSEKDGVAIGSNAKTPYYVYRKALNLENGKYDRYQIVYDAENANVADKPALETVTDAERKLIPHAQEQKETKCIQIDEDENLKVYVTGFCPYATTGYKKEQEGVWLFRGKPTASLDLYLEDCHIYSRNKTEDGHSYIGKFDPKANIFQDDYARGSGGVFVFECNSEAEFEVPKDKAFEVSIHTIGKNVLKSNFGCFYQIWGMRAYQVSSPIQVRLSSDLHVDRSRTHLTFDDIWPTGFKTEVVGEEEVTTLETTRTNGFLSLQKLANNAPSIDLGNPLTVVNFRGGQVELQNAQNVSDKYKTTLAISYRSGIMAAGGVNLQMAYGIGTDAATEGEVYFYDGTISVIPMKVESESERKYYLMDPQIDQNGDTIKDANGEPIDSEWTTCLRCPQKTYVRGGSICMLRACMSPTSKGGAPTDGFERLGRFFYTPNHGYRYNTVDGKKPSESTSAQQWLVEPTEFPGNSNIFDNLVGYYTSKDYQYGLESVTPDKNEMLTLWIPNGYGGAEAEYDQKLIAWKTCMTYVHATIALDYKGEIGGDAYVEPDEKVTNLLYCHMDDYIHQVISDHTGEGDNVDYTYEAPVKIPDGFTMEGMEDIGGYIYLEPDNVGDAVYDVLNENEYKISKKIYYITTALADTWMNFTAPFDVENIYIVESYPETKLESYFATELELYDPENDDIHPYTATRLFQGKHNADFASFFGMAIALGTEESFEEIKDDYLEWAYLQDHGNEAGQYPGTREDYDWRGVHPLEHYDGTNFMNAHFYLYKNTGEWITNSKVTEFTTGWNIAPSKQKNNNVLLEKGETYSMLFPYCLGCDVTEDREYWDYWTGKFLIFESTTAPDDNPHTLAGKNQALEEFALSPTPGKAYLTGNMSFAKFEDYNDPSIFYYKAERDASSAGFVPLFDSEENKYQTIYPTNSILKVNLPDPTLIKSVSRTGQIVYDQSDVDNNGNQNGTSGHMPTVGGGNDLFITSIAGGINVAVAAPQNVRVLSSTGAVIYSGYVTTAVDIQLPTTGIYIVSGENEVQKILF